MDYQIAFNIALSLASGCGVFVAKILWDTLTTLRADMTKLAEAINQTHKDTSNTYVRRDDWAIDVGTLQATMNRGFDQLAAQIAGKADKS